ncbi:OLC1v1023337C1 [Oldenlandia corymbosa var. corymbosa]|uniref:OLC1v1023337C1 n=1 Tax=Oldenlandia corymbosa var. corymbosa TaxID=529605 RepID=A0AAV1BZP8_OLDCO|nr:OLC1v1023337C1 [Oldenlandia corymbosa var. corymbosa]
MQSSISLTHGSARTYCPNRFSRNPRTVNEITSPIFRPDTSAHLPALKLLSKLQYESEFRKPISLVPLKTKSSNLCSISSSNATSPDESSIDSTRSTTNKSWIEIAGEAFSTAFPLWVAIGCLLGLLKPSSYNWVKPQWTVMGITLTMLGMGMTLTFDDLKGALAMPKELFTGFVLQYSVMPLSAYFVSKLLCLPSHYAAGLILVGCCPGGTASNIVTYIARGNVALSVLMTAASTLTAVIMTPFLTAKLAGQYVAVDAVGLFLSTLQVVLLPVLAGAFLNQYFQSFVKVVSPVMPPIAVLTVAILCGNAIAQSSSTILMSGQLVVLATVLLHASGFCFGYVLSRMLGVDVSSSRTISIEVGMQNSVLGVVLATQHFGNPLTAVPCAVSSYASSVIAPLQLLPDSWIEKKKCLA